MGQRHFQELVNSSETWEKLNDESEKPMLKLKPNELNRKDSLKSSDKRRRGKRPKSRPLGSPPSELKSPEKLKKLQNWKKQESPLNKKLSSKRIGWTRKPPKRKNCATR